MVKKIFTRWPLSRGYVIGRAPDGILAVADRLGYMNSCISPSGDTIYVRRIDVNGKYCVVEASEQRRGLLYSAVTLVGYGNSHDLLKASLDTAVRDFSVENLSEECMSPDSIRFMDALCEEILAEETVKMN